MFGDHYGYMVGMHGFWWAFWIVVVLVLLLRRTDQGGTANRRRESARELLQRRLASGEIDIEEYEKRKTLLDRDAGDAES